MNTKLFAFLITFLAGIAALTFSFASTGHEIVDDTKNMIHDVESKADELGNKAENGINNMKESIKNTTDNVVDDTKNSINTMENDYDSRYVPNSDYSVSRTSSLSNDATYLGLGSTAWTWLIGTVTAIGVIAIVWYYFADNNTISRD